MLRTSYYFAQCFADSVTDVPVARVVATHVTLVPKQGGQLGNSPFLEIFMLRAATSHSHFATSTSESTGCGPDLLSDWIKQVN